MTAHHFQTVNTYRNKQKWNQINIKTKTQKKTKKKISQQSITTDASRYVKFKKQP